MTAARPMARTSFFMFLTLLQWEANVRETQTADDRLFDGAVVVFYPVQICRALRVSSSEGR